MRSLIKGIDILLHGSNGTSETIHNILVGEPSTAEFPLLGGNVPAYTLGIPKGDNHNWTDSIVEFFGSRFRTIGYPEQGIEENMPLSWHKKVKVQQLVTTGDCTFYEKDTFRKHVFRDVFFYDHRGRKISKNGVMTDGDAGVLVYASSHSDFDYFPKSGDMVVFCDCPIAFDASSQQSVSESMAQLRKEFRYAVVASSTQKYNGALPDYEITAR